MFARLSHFLFFFFNDTATTEIYTLSLHDALPILGSWSPTRTRAVPTPPDPVTAVVNSTPGLSDSGELPRKSAACELASAIRPSLSDRKSTRLNSSHTVISYAVFCLKKKNRTRERPLQRRCAGLVYDYRKLGHTSAVVNPLHAKGP